MKNVDEIHVRVAFNERLIKHCLSNNLRFQEKASFPQICAKINNSI